MKLYCNQDGIHFPEEFEKTLLPPCNLWGDKGLGNLPVEYKKKLWDWAFSLPADEISIKFGLGIVFGFGGMPSIAEDKFENMVPDWQTKTEEERKQYQREFFKANLPKVKKVKKDKLVN